MFKKMLCSENFDNLYVKEIDDFGVGHQCIHIYNENLVQAAANPFMGMGDPTQPISASPARPPPPNPQKSAFDDLEDAMRISLGGSPAKQSAPITQQPQPMTQHFGDVMMSQPMMFGSPARQPMMGMAMGSMTCGCDRRIFHGNIENMHFDKIIH